MAPKIDIRPFFADQQQIFFYDLLVGYCGDKPGMKMSFLAGRNCQLTTEERAEVLEHVWQQVGEVRETRENAEVFREFERRRNLASR